MKTDTLKKSLLDYAIKGKLTARFRRENSELNAFDEISTYNDEIKQKRKNLEKELKTLESKLKKAPTRHCETSAGGRGKTKHDPHAVIASERSERGNPQTKQELKSQIQSLKKEIAKCKEITPLFCHTTSPCHTDLECSEREVSQNAVSLENDNPHTPPFEIPNSWAWVKLGDICEIISGEITDLQEENLPLLDVKYLRSKGDKKLANSGNFANVNDRLILMDGENSGEIFITKEKGFLGSTLKKLEFSSLSQVEFMDFMLLCYKDFFKGNKKGAAIPHLDRKLFTNLSIPLPPLCEQEYIVQILDTLFTLKKGLRIE